MGVPPATRCRGWRAYLDIPKYTTRYWWDGAIKQRIDTRNIDNEECIMFDFEPQYAYDESNNVVGQAALEGHPPLEKLGNPMQETPAEDLSDEEKRTNLALSAQLVKVLNANCGVADTGTSAPDKF